MPNDITGSLIGVSKPRNVKTKVGVKPVTEFQVQTTDGAVLECQHWGTIDENYLGNDVSFTAYEKEYNGKISYTLKESADACFQKAKAVRPTSSSAAGVSVRQAAPAQVKHISVSPASTQIPHNVAVVVPTQPSVAEDMNKVRADAEAIFASDLDYVRKQLGEGSPEVALAQALAAFQAIRATLFIETNRRR